MSSFSTKLTAAKRLVSELRKWPEDSHKIYASFRTAQINRFDNSKASQASLPSVESIERQTDAAHTILQDSNKLMFPVSVKLLHPNGMPSYYERICKEALKSSKKVGFFKSAKDSLFGWWK